MTTSLAHIGLICAALSGPLAFADSLQSAHRLLRAADVQHHYETRTVQQTRAIIRTYSSIVSMSADISLPAELTQKIFNCYTEVYAWENFEDGLAQILADNLTEKELQLLIDFYTNLGLPPFEIQNFRNTIAKSTLIQEVSLDYLLTNSASCVESDVKLILDFVASQSAPDADVFAVD